MNNFRRGFKTEANEYARDFRRELDLQLYDPLCPWALAQHLAIPVKRLSDLATAIPDQVRLLMTTNESEFSAITVFDSTARMIVYNDAHHPTRQASNIAHELAHGVLGHPPTPPFNEVGCRHFDQRVEAEAEWLGPALLVSEEAALRIASNKIAVEQAAGMYKVSPKLMRFRLNVTGAFRRIARTRKR